MEAGMIFFVMFIVFLVLGIAGGVVGLGLWLHRRIERKCSAAEGASDPALKARMDALDSKFANFAKDVHDSFPYYVKDPSAMVHVDSTTNTILVNSPANTSAAISLNGAMISSTGADLFLSGPSSKLSTQADASVKLDRGGLAVLNGHLRVGSYILRDDGGLQLCRYTTLGPENCVNINPWKAASTTPDTSAPPAIGNLFQVPLSPQL